MQAKGYFYHMISPRAIDVEIDKLTRSIENAISGDSFKTEILTLTSDDLKRIKKPEWLFDWKYEAKQADKTVYKLVIEGNTDVIQGLVSIQDRGDHVFMALIESSGFNRGAGKLYLGVPGNLVAFACKLSFDKSYDGYVSFESKTSLKEHYKKSLGAHVLFGNVYTAPHILDRFRVNLNWKPKSPELHLPFSLLFRPSTTWPGFDS